MRSPLSFDLHQDRVGDIRVDSKLAEPDLKDIPRRSTLDHQSCAGKNAHGDQFLRVPAGSILMDHADNARRLSKR
jgi:hypothetical protein